MAAFSMRRERYNGTPSDISFAAYEIHAFATRVGKEERWFSFLWIHKASLDNGR